MFYAPQTRRSDALRRAVEAVVPIDRRMRFNDMHAIPPHQRLPGSPVIQFYSSVPNIGNYLPVAGIREFASLKTDTWCMHEPVDFDYVNANYGGVIIGGAGLLAAPFERFWREFASQCRLPVTIWGVGLCLQDWKGRDEASVNRRTASQVAARADLVNVRDDLTADFLGVAGIDVTACPTLGYLRNFRVADRRRWSLLSAHPGLGSDDDHRQLHRQLRARGRVKTTLNEQTRLKGVDDIVRRRYLSGRVVVTSRLHGAIISYGLGIPYVALARDQKVRAFGRLYGGGVVIEDPMDLSSALDSLPEPVSRPDALAPVLRFADRATEWTKSVTSDA